MENNKILKKAWKVILLAAIVYVLMGIYADFKKLIDVFQSFKWLFLPLIILLTLTNYFLRFLKWHYLLSRIEEVGIKESLWVFSSGLVMAITPGKLGEVWKAWLVRDLKGTNTSKTIPVVIIDRFTDVIGLAILASIGSLVYGIGKFLIVLVFAGFFAFVASLKIQSFSDFFISKLENKFSEYSSDVRIMHSSFLKLVSWKGLLVMSLLASFSWFFECLGLYITVKGFDHDISILQSVFVFSFGSIAGAVSMIPGGVGIAEASMTGLLRYFSLPAEVSVGATLIIRFGTLWFGASLGGVVYFIGRRVLMKSTT